MGGTWFRFRDRAGLFLMIAASARPRNFHG
jgi:hypothetical protein